MSLAELIILIIRPSRKPRNLERCLCWVDCRSVFKLAAWDCGTTPSFLERKRPNLNKLVSPNQHETELGNGRGDRAMRACLGNIPECMPPEWNPPDWKGEIPPEWNPPEWTPPDAPPDIIPSLVPLLLMGQAVSEYGWAEDRDSGAGPQRGLAQS